MRYAAKRDTAERPIIDCLERAGWDVWPLSQPGFPDLMVRKQAWPPGMVQLLEVKTASRKVRKEQLAQADFIASTHTPIVRTPLEALHALMVTQEF